MESILKPAERCPFISEGFSSILRQCSRSLSFVLCSFAFMWMIQENGTGSFMFWAKPGQVHSG